MKVSSRVGDPSGCTVRGTPGGSPAWPAFRGPRAAATRPAASGPMCPGRCVVARPSRRLGPRPPGYLGAREAAAQPGPGQAWAVSESFLITGVN